MPRLFPAFRIFRCLFLCFRLCFAWIPSGDRGFDWRTWAARKPQNASPGCRMVKRCIKHINMDISRWLHCSSCSFLQQCKKKLTESYCFTWSKAIPKLKMFSANASNIVKRIALGRGTKPNPWRCRRQLLQTHLPEKIRSVKATCIQHWEEFIEVANNCIYKSLSKWEIYVVCSEYAHYIILNHLRSC